VEVWALIVGAYVLGMVLVTVAFSKGKAREKAAERSWASIQRAGVVDGRWTR
jgi:hypothetical protein